MKLDFKDIAALEPAMLLLTEHGDDLHAPLWINADIVAGPNSEKARLERSPLLYNIGLL